jgi:hypothetical protein
MTACAHPDLHLEEGTHYCCASCGQRFVVLLQVDDSPDVDAVDQEPATDEVDVSGQIGRYVSPDRRLPASKRKN